MKFIAALAFVITAMKMEQHQETFKKQHDYDDGSCSIDIYLEGSLQFLMLLLMMTTIQTLKFMNLSVDKLRASMWHHLRHSPRYNVPLLCTALALPQSQL